MDALSQLVEGNVGATVVVFGLLWAALVLQGQTLLWFGKRELTRIEARDNATSASLTQHIESEEEIWDTIREIELKVNDIQNKLPNGDLKVALSKLDTLTAGVALVGREVRQHNDEAEKWKRKIERHDVRLTNLEVKKRG